jgi:hypothetical protein
MPIKKRFSLAAILVVVTILALLFGYGQWRRRAILDSVENLGHEGVSVRFSDSWWKAAWLPTPRGADLNVTEPSAGVFKIGGATYSAEDGNERLAKLRRRLSSLGVKFFVVSVSAFDGSHQQLAYDLESGEAANSEYQLKASPDPREMRALPE